MARFRHSSLLPWTAVALVGALSAPATAAQRVALAIGNASYEHAPALANPLNDAADMDAALERLGFKVTRLENVDQASLRRGLQDFALAASASEVAVVFYAGHGIEVDQRNFLVPVDARLASDQDVEFEAVPLELVQRAVERASGLRLVILDACRENPFAVKMQRAGATRSIGRGLARVEPSGETLIAYAAKEGTVAADGAGRHSPFSEALLAHLEEPGLEVGLMFRKVRDAVLASTGGRQEPFVYGSLSSRGVYLSGPPSPAGSPAATVTEPDNGTMPERVTSEQLAARAYEAAERVGAVVAYEAVIRRFPESIFAELARAQVEKLRVAEASATSDGRVAIATTPEGNGIHLRENAIHLRTRFPTGAFFGHAAWVASSCRRCGPRRLFRFPLADRLARAPRVGAVRARLVPARDDGADDMAEGFAEHRRMAQEQALEMARDGQQAVLEVHPHLRPVRRAAGFPATPEQALAVIREQPRQGDQDEVREQLLPHPALAATVEVLNVDQLLRHLVQFLDAPALVVEVRQVGDGVHPPVQQRGAQHIRGAGDLVLHQAQRGLGAASLAARPGADLDHPVGVVRC